MRAWWILPNRDQRDDILASDGEKILPLRQVLDPKIRPEGFSHGIPTELLEKCGSTAFTGILFAQRFNGWEGNKQLFSVLSPAGGDSSGRVVYLGLLFILEPGERPRFDVPYTALSEEDRTYAHALIQRMASSFAEAPAANRGGGRGDLWAQSVRDLSELPSGRGPATNVALDRSVVRFSSLYEVGPGGSIRKAPILRTLRMATIVLLFAVVGGWLTVRACEQYSRPAAQTGVVTWHLS
jgi:hypothetical protein